MTSGLVCSLPKCQILQPFLEDCPLPQPPKPRKPQRWGSAFQTFQVIYIYILPVEIRICRSSFRVSCLSKLNWTKIGAPKTSLTGSINIGWPFLLSWIYEYKYKVAKNGFELAKTKENLILYNDIWILALKIQMGPFLLVFPTLCRVDVINEL